MIGGAIVGKSQTEQTAETSSPALGQDLAAKPNASSIMSAPRDPKKNTIMLVVLVLSALLVASIISNVVAFGLAAKHSAEVTRLERELQDNEAVIKDLKTRLHEQS